MQKKIYKSNRRIISTCSIDQTLISYFPYNFVISFSRHDFPLCIFISMNNTPNPETYVNNQIKWKIEVK